MMEQLREPSLSSVLRRGLDRKPIRIAYRLARAAWRSICQGTYDLFFDGGDAQWPLGLAFCALLFFTILIVLQ